MNKSDNKERKICDIRWKHDRPKIATMTTKIHTKNFN